MKDFFIRKKIQIFSLSRVLRISFPFGSSSRLVFLLWCVCGGLLLHFLECNFLKILIRPTYEEPVDTPEDILDRGLKILFPPHREAIVAMRMNSPSNLTRKLAEATIVPKV